MAIHKPVIPSRPLAHLNQPVVAPMGAIVAADAFLLKEDGDYLLLESSNLVIETGDLTFAYTAPSGLTAAVGGENIIDLAWTDNSSGEGGFYIERSTDEANWARIATAGANAVSYSDQNADYGTTYYYRVQAYGASGVSAFSNTASVEMTAISLDSIAETTLVTGNVGGGDWHGRTAMSVLDDGNWILVWLTGTSHTSTDKQLHCKFSDDGGATWTATDTDLDGGGVTIGYMAGAAPGDGREPGVPALFLAPDGTLILTAQKADYSAPAIDGVWQTTSSDDGSTWSAWAQITFGGVVDQQNTEQTGDYFVLSGSIYAVGAADGDRVIFESDDNGTSWDHFCDINAAGTTSEPGMEYVAVDEILVVTRDTGNDDAHDSRSTDFGTSWTAWSDIGDVLGAICRPRVKSLEKMKGTAPWWTDDVLIMSGCTFREPGNSHPRRNALWVSRDDGNTWAGPLWLDDEANDGGYGDMLYDSSADKCVVVSYSGTTVAADLIQYKFGIDGV